MTSSATCAGVCLLGHTVWLTQPADRATLAWEGVNSGCARYAKPLNSQRNRRITRGNFLPVTPMGITMPQRRRTSSEAPVRLLNDTVRVANPRHQRDELQEQIGVTRPGGPPMTSGTRYQTRAAR